MRALILAFAVVAIGLGASSLPAAAQSETPAAAETYTLDPAHTQVAFSIERFGFNHVLGRFDAIAGDVSLDQANPEQSSVNVTIQTASISAGDATRNEHLRGERWLNATAFPTMTFRSTGVRRTGEDTAEVTGDLTIKGVTRPVTLTVRLNRIGVQPSNGRQSAGFSATTTVSRAAFGITTAQPLIGDEIRITIEALGLRPAA
jgi:polyisoprenoid-binding protein YceI